MRSHYISRQTFATVEWKAQTFISLLHLVLFWDGSTVDAFWMEQLKGIVNNALYSDFYTKYRLIEPEQATQIQESQLEFACTYKIQMFMIMHVPSIVKFSDNQSKIGLNSFMKKVQQVMDHRQNVKVSDVRLNPLQHIKISFGCCPCKLYLEQSLLYSLYFKKR